MCSTSIQRFTVIAVAALSISGCALSENPPTKTTGSAAAVSNATPPAVTGAEKKTDSGLRYIDIKEGNGPMPQKGQQVTVHYTGWLTKGGTKFDSSVDRGQPFTFQIGVGQVISGWDEGVSTMKVGGKRRLLIPANLGYGERGAGGVIPPNADLTFDVELLGVR